MTKHSAKSTTGVESAGGPEDTCDFQSEHAARLIRTCAETLASFSQAPKSQDYIECILDAVRLTFRSRYYILASGIRYGDEMTHRIIRTNIEDKDLFQREEDELPALFKQVFATDDKTYCKDITSDEERSRMCVGMSVVLDTCDRPPDDFGLLFGLVGRVTTPDPDFPMVRFLTYDEYFLRITLIYTAEYIRHEYQERWLEFSSYKTMPNVKARVIAARKLLDFMRSIGFATCPQVLTDFLLFEKEAFLEGARTAMDFEYSLGEAKELLTYVQDEDERERVSHSLFDCYLALLTEEGREPLLSKRIEIAEERVHN